MVTGKLGGGGDRTHHIPVIHLDSDTRPTALKFHDREKKEQMFVYLSYRSR